MPTLTGSSAVLLVDDVEAIYTEVQRRGAPIDYTIYDASSGFREFGLQDPDGHDIGIGQPIERERGAAA